VLGTAPAAAVIGGAAGTGAGAAAEFGDPAQAASARAAAGSRAFLMGVPAMGVMDRGGTATRHFHSNRSVCQEV
jgi:hypothetical protein